MLPEVAEKYKELQQRIITSEDIMTAHNLMNSIVNLLHGNSEKFYHRFHKTFIDSNYVFKNIGRERSLRVSFDIANGV